MQPLKVGDRAPDFSATTHDGRRVSLVDYLSKSKLVLFFYPKADTPGCTQEAMDFSRLAKGFEKAGTAVVGVSADPVRALGRFRDKHGLKVPLLSDESHAMPEPRTGGGLPGRARLIRRSPGLSCLQAALRLLI